MTSYLVTETLEAYGHSNVRATHKTTFEFTKDPHLTLRGDCVIAVKASKGAVDLSSEFKELARNKNSKITVTIRVGRVKETAVGYGDPKLLLTHPTDLVARKSDFVCGRTLMIHSNKAACNFSSNLIKALRDPNQKVKITLTIEASE